MPPTCLCSDIDQHLAPLEHGCVALLSPLLAVAVVNGIARGSVDAAALALRRLVDLAVAIKPDLCIGIPTGSQAWAHTA